MSECLDKCRQSLIIVCHRVTDSLIRKYRTIHDSFNMDGDVFLVCHDDNNKNDFVIPNDINYLRVSMSDLVELKFHAIADGLLPGSNHFILMWFARQYPEYSYYWNIEYDVDYTGDWRKLFKAFRLSKSDFLSCHIRHFHDEPGWYWWKVFYSGDTHISLANRIASFNPIYRLSKRAARLLDSKFSEGWGGHHEVAIPTILNYYGYILEDIGGSGEYVSQHNTNKFYCQQTPPPYGTMRHKPEFGLNEISAENQYLYHPVKH